MLNNIWKSKKIYWSIFISVLVLAIFYLLVSVYVGEKVLGGVYLENMDISFADKTTVRDKTKWWSEAFEGKKIKFVTPNYTKEITIGEIIYEIKAEDAINKACNTNKYDIFGIKIINILALFKGKRYIYAEIVISRNKLDRIFQEIEQKVNVEAKNAFLIKNGNSIQIKTERYGKKANTIKNISLTETAIKERNFAEVLLVINNIKPEIIFDDIKHIGKKLAKFSTPLTGSSNNRITNIRIACRHLNGKIVFPGKIFSLNKSIGERNVSNGYKNAPVILKGKLVDGVGGGICQVASTLYNSILLSELNVIERVPHSIAPSYVKAGLDAAISGNDIDFCFKNIRKSPIVIFIEVRNQALVAEIFGGRDEATNFVKFESETITEIVPTEERIIDFSLKEEKIIVQNGVIGKRVNIYKITFNNKTNSQIRKKLYQDYYPSINAIIRVNPKFNNTE